jgi:mono/diheme cytochrome c family protein
MMRRSPVDAWLVLAVALCGLAAAAEAARAAGAPDLGTEAQREAGRKLYEHYCSQCHGDKGDGQGPAAVHLRPLPRDFTSAKFKIRTTPNGSLPTTDDLKNIIRRGMPYTSMPSWPNFSDEQLTDLAYYVKTFSPDFAKPDNVPDQVPLPPAPKQTKESIEAGRKVYQDTGCVRCHGSLGRGDGPSAPTLVDDWNHPIRPADLTQKWTFRGGSEREDIFRVLSTGLNGTPMPSFLDALPPEQRWALTDYIESLSGGPGPAYATLVVAKRIDAPIDLAAGAEQFAAAPVSRFPIVGQIMEPGRSFHPPTISIRVQAIYDQDSLALLLRWDDLTAQTTGHNSPALVVPPEEEEQPDSAAGAAPSGGAEGDIWGEEAAPEPAPKAAGGDDFWGEESGGGTAGAAAPVLEFSDAVAVQFPVQAPTGARKPYFIFGDPQNPVDLWFFDLARPEALQFTARGSADVSANDTGDVTGRAHYDQGEWSVIFRRSLRTPSGVPFVPGQFVPVTFSVWDGLTRERGNRRGLTVWYHLYVEPASVPSPGPPMVRAAALVLGLEFVVIAWVRWSRHRRSAPEPTGTGASQEPRSGP